MRPQSEIKVKVRQKIIGGRAPLICIPLVATEKSTLLDQASALRPLVPDIFEWRADSYRTVADLADCLATLAALRSVIGDIPLIFTCRIETEGGMQPLSRETRLAVIEGAIRSGLTDIVDIELGNRPSFLDAVRSAAGRQGTKLILSYHDFTRTPDEAFILDTLTQAQAMGADIAKMAVMPQDYNDVLTLLNATMQARSNMVKIPMITIAMGDQGGVTRLAGGLFGSDITFAAGHTASAPGQMPIIDLRQAMSLLYGT